ncbi:MAG TPA: tRNA pseudouridine(55) synthase TruB [Candidatus Binatia bacterium]|nr:tRNA pseudouridine(55) synthase TruB [Candidatus Binatia bacterium]
MVNQSGILLVDKPEGPSSAHVVRRVKAGMGAKKIGHLGTLDPFASGLLLLGLNEGTKIADIYLTAAKSYRGVLVLGVETDSQDRTGKILKVCSVPPLGMPELERLARQFTGDLEQVPPMFSALKRDGVRLYRLARQGKEVPREPRLVRIEALVLRQLNEVEIEFDVTCSRGTYVRTLTADMGAFLGCGAHLKSLRRIACGHLSVTEAITLDELERLAANKQIPLLSLPAALAHLPAVTWEDRRLSRLRQGQQETLAHIEKPRADETVVRILDRRGNLVALAGWDEEMPGGRWRLRRVFRA